MASNSFLITILLIAFSITTMASDPEINQDFVGPNNITTLTNKYFSYTKTRGVFEEKPKNFTVTKISSAEFPALEGQSVSYEIIHFPEGAIHPLHAHPSASELFIVISGILEVAFVDTQNMLYEQKIKAGDVFVFPKDLIHYEFNRGSKGPATAIAAYTSSSPRTVLVPMSVFGSGIEEEILAMSFKIHGDTVKKIKAGVNKT